MIAITYGLPTYSPECYCFTVLTRSHHRPLDTPWRRRHHQAHPFTTICPRPHHRPLLLLP